MNRIELQSKQLMTSTFNIRCVNKELKMKFHLENQQFIQADLLIIK